MAAHHHRSRHHGGLPRQTATIVASSTRRRRLKEPEYAYSPIGTYGWRTTTLLICFLRYASPRLVGKIIFYFIFQTDE